MQNKELVRRFVDEVVNGRDADAIKRFVRADYLDHEPLPGQLAGREGLARWYRDFLAAFPDLRWEIEDQVAEEDKVVTRVQSTGTHREPFLGIAPTGRRVSVAVLLFHRLVDGRIAEGHTFPDGLAALRQLGQIRS